LKIGIQVKEALKLSFGLKGRKINRIGSEDVNRKEII